MLNKSHIEIADLVDVRIDGFGGVDRSKTKLVVVWYIPEVDATDTTWIHIWELGFEKLRLEIWDLIGRIWENQVNFIQM